MKETLLKILVYSTIFLPVAYEIIYAFKNYKKTFKNSNKFYLSKEEYDKFISDANYLDKNSYD